MNKLESTVDEVWQIDDDTPGAMGKFRVTGKNDKGEPMDIGWRLDSRLCQARRQMEGPDADSSSDSTKERLIVKAKRPPRKRWALRCGEKIRSCAECRSTRDRALQDAPRSRANASRHFAP